MDDCLAVILAGGKGKRLSPLTDDRAKPAVPFAGAYRIIDFSLSNCLNSGLKQSLVLTQYKSLSLNRHVDRAWRRFFCGDLGEFIDVVSPQQRLTDHWYAGTADAVYQNIYSIEKVAPKYTLILAGDHIYKMDYRQLVDFHKSVNADLTIGTIEVDRDTARQFGVMQIDNDRRIVDFKEKPVDPAPIPGSSGLSLASMGIYVFNTQFLLELLCDDATDRDSTHDFGHDLIPSVINSHRVFAYPFRDKGGCRPAYWRDVGTVDAYYDANMDLISAKPRLDLYDAAWPIRTFHPDMPPPKFVDSPAVEPECHGQSFNSMVGCGSIISGGSVRNCVFGNNVRINSLASVENSILFNGVQVGENAVVRQAIIDKHVRVPAGVRIGCDRKEDVARDLMITDTGIVVVTRASQLGTSPAVFSTK